MDTAYTRMARSRGPTHSSEREQLPGLEPITLVGPNVASALGAFLHDLMDSLGTRPAGTLVPIRLTAGYSYAISAGFDDFVPILLIPSYDLNPISDCQSIAGSFVSQVAADLEAWRQAEQPPANDGSYTFDLAVHTQAAGHQMMVHTALLRYPLPFGLKSA